MEALVEAADRGEVPRANNMNMPATQSGFSAGVIAPAGRRKARRNPLARMPIGVGRARALSSTVPVASTTKGAARAAPGSASRVRRKGRYPAPARASGYPD